MDKKEYATWNFPLWVDNDYDLYQAKMRLLKQLSRANRRVGRLDVYRFLIANIGYISQDGAKIDDVDLASVASDWEAERQAGQDDN